MWLHPHQRPPYARQEPPPRRSPFSYSLVERPNLALASAAARPATPLPITTTSQSAGVAVPTVSLIRVGSAQAFLRALLHDLRVLLAVALRFGHDRLPRLEIR